MTSLNTVASAYSKQFNRHGLTKLPEPIYIKSPRCQKQFKLGNSTQLFATKPVDHFTE
jgi:hypothetical protein